MLLPQSSAFATLRNRLSAVSSLGFLQTVPRRVATQVEQSSRACTDLRARSSSLNAPTAVRGSSFAGTSGGATTVSSLAARVSRTDGATPDPPSIQWSELLAHFRQVQKRRASAIGAGGGGRGHGGADPALASGRAASRTRDGATSVDGVSPPTSAGFGNSVPRSTRRRATQLGDGGQAPHSAVGGGRAAHNGDNASMTSSNVTGGSGGRGAPRMGSSSGQRALSPPLPAAARGRANHAATTSSRDARVGSSSAAKR